MFTIYQNTGNEGHDFESFKERLIQICNDHRQTGRALAFAFILYDFENPHLWKVLNDAEYWLALNQISGSYLTVFSIYYSPEKQKNTFQFLTKISTNYNPRVATNKLIQRYFKGTRVNYPAILFFQVDKDKVIDSLLIDLKAQEIEKGFLELRDFFNRAVLALKRISPENKQNLKEIFDCLENEVTSFQFNRRLVRGFNNTGNVAGLLSSIKGLWGG